MYSVGNIFGISFFSSCFSSHFLHDNLVLAARLKLLVWQHNAVADDGLVLDRDLLAQDRHALDLEPVLGHCCAVVCTWRSALDARPATHLRVPANDRVQDAGVLLDVDVVQNDRVPDTGALTDNHVRSDRNVGSELEIQIKKESQRTDECCLGKYQHQSSIVTRSVPQKNGYLGVGIDASCGVDVDGADDLRAAGSALGQLLRVRLEDLLQVQSVNRHC